MSQQDWLEKDFYKILGVSESVSDKELTKAYRKLARKFHPDANPNNSRAEAKFKDVSRAYDVLGDAKTRREYDEVRKYGAGASRFGNPFKHQQQGGRPAGASNFGFNGPDFSEFVGDIFGGGFRGASNQTGPQKGENIQTEIFITFNDSISGTMMSISVPGKLASSKVKVRIPPGVRNGQKIRLKGQGGPGLNRGQPGDLLVIVKVGAHAFFGRSGNNLTLELPVTIAEAAFGAKVKVPTLDGGSVTLKIPAATNAGKVLRVRGKGIKAQNEQGDLMVTIRVDIPEVLSSEQADALQAYADATFDNPRAFLEGA